MERAKYDNGIKRYAKLIAFKLLTTLPVSRFMRADLFRKLGVDIEKGTVRIGKIHIDTLHPEDIHIGSGTAIADG